MYYCRMNRILIFTLLLLSSSLSLADQIRVAVASNFAPAMRQISQQFEQQTGHRVVISSGSTGKQYAQISNGAPYDVFFAADVKRPKLLEQQGIAVPGSRFTYALGKLVLWSPNKQLVDNAGQVLQSERFRYLAIANPKLAPYGRAAQQTLSKLGLWQALRKRMVRGENIGHAYQFVKSGNAELGFVAASQVLQPGKPVTGSLWLIPNDYYAKIEQQAVALSDDAVTRSFMDFVRSEAVRELVRQFGYKTS